MARSFQWLTYLDSTIRLSFRWFDQKYKMMITADALMMHCKDVALSD